MKNRKKSALCLALCLSLLLPFPVRAQDTNTAELAASFQKLCDGTLSPGESVSDWAVIALNLCGITGENRAYQKGLEQYVTDTCRAKGTLDRVKATEYHRIALAAMAVGMDPRCVGRDRIDLVADGVWNFGPGLEKQGLNGLLYALILLDAGDFELPADCGMTRESLVDRVLARQEEDGSFGLAEGSSDADITAMALQALGPYREREDVKAAGERAFAWLSSLLTERGTFLTGGSESAETMAQCILALCAFGIDPAGAESFSRGGDAPFWRIWSGSAGTAATFMPSQTKKSIPWQRSRCYLRSARWKSSKAEKSSIISRQAEKAPAVRYAGSSPALLPQGSEAPSLQEGKGGKRHEQF